MLFACFALIDADAQSSNPTQTANIQTLNLPQLDTLYALAYIHSPAIHMQSAFITKTHEATKQSQKLWLDAFKINANYRQGSYGNSVVNQLEVGYTVGPSVSFSLYQLFGVRNQVKANEAEEQMAYYKREQMYTELRMQINRLYWAIKSQQQILQIKTEAVNTSFSHLKMAEKEFQENQITIGELSRVTEIYNTSRTALEICMNEMKIYYMDLEELVGLKLDNI